MAEFELGWWLYEKTEVLKKVDLSKQESVENVKDETTFQSFDALDATSKTLD